MKKSKWFDGSKFVPAHFGVYEVKGRSYRHWSGKRWGYTCKDVQGAYLWDFTEGLNQSPTWRGIKK